MVPNRTVPRISRGLWQRTETESREVETEEHIVTRTEDTYACTPGERGPPLTAEGDKAVVRRLFEEVINPGDLG